MTKPMSSEMREEVVSLRRLAEVIRKYGTCAPSALETVANNIDALLALTEAGADGAVAWLCEWTDEDDGETVRVSFEFKRGAENRALEVGGDAHVIPLYTHPQDASGDAVMREALERIRDYEGDPRTPVRNSVRKSGIARAALNAMQAKEAK